MINHNFFHSLVLPLAADFFPPLICNFCWSHLFHMDFSFFSFCISPRQAICILSAHQPISFLHSFATFDGAIYITWIFHFSAFVFLPGRQFAFYLQFWSKLGELTWLLPKCQYVFLHKTISHISPAIIEPICSIGESSKERMTLLNLYHNTFAVTVIHQGWK